MEITGFVTQNFLSSFAGTLVAVEIIVFTTKDFPIIKKIPTKFYTFVLSIIHLIIVQVTNGKTDITVEYIYMLFINSLVVVLILCGGFDTIMEKFKNIKETLNLAEADIAQVNNKAIATTNTTENPTNNEVEKK